MASATFDISQNADPVNTDIKSERDAFAEVRLSVSRAGFSPGETMSFTCEITAAIETAPFTKLNDLGHTLWKAWGADVSHG